MAAAVGHSAACEPAPGLAPHHCRGTATQAPLWPAAAHHPHLCPQPTSAGGRGPPPVLCPCCLSENRLVRESGQAGADRVPPGRAQRSRPRAVRAPCGKPVSLSQNRRMEASRLGQGVALRLELVSRRVPRPVSRGRDLGRVPAPAASPSPTRPRALSGRCVRRPRRPSPGPRRPRGWLPLRREHGALSPGPRPTGPASALLRGGLAPRGAAALTRPPRPPQDGAQQGSRPETARQPVPLSQRRRPGRHGAGHVLQRAGDPRDAQPPLPPGEGPALLPEGVGGGLLLPGDPASRPFRVLLESTGDGPRGHPCPPLCPGGWCRTRTAWRWKAETARKRNGD